MRGLPLLLAVACTHTQPPPAPLAVPPENAATPAPPENAPGPAAAPAADLASPITAAGTEVPLGLDWGAKGREPAAEIFKNVKVLGGLSGDRFMAAMHSMRANLGEKCVFCHDVEGKNYASDEKKTKLRAREMVRMNAEINERTFQGKVRVTCWTCHRGEAKPQKGSNPQQLPPLFDKLPAADLARPAEKVFKNVRDLAGMDAKNFGLIMAWFARELGVKCTHCHQEGDYAADTPKKTRAHEMLLMTGYVAKCYYGDDSPVGCGTCHRGSIKPPRTPSDTP
jgi:hypothetical protein